MKPEWGDDYSICCCVSATKTGQEIQLFGARANLAKTLLYAFNGGFDEKHRIQCGPKMERITSEYADYDEVIEKFDWWTDREAEYSGTCQISVRTWKIHVDPACTCTGWRFFPIIRWESTNGKRSEFRIH